jgi:glycosyltransferase involved in cell wall biosynthesis
MSVIRIKNISEIIIIDDASNDETVSIIESFIKKNKNFQIQLYAKKSNLGLVNSLNIGLKLAKTEYIYIIASDDIPVSEGIDQCFAKLEYDKKLKFIIGGGINFFDSNKEQLPVYRKQHVDFFNLSEMEIKKKIFTNFPSPLLLQSCLFRKSVLLEINGWDPDIIWDDYPIYVKLLQKYSKNGEDFLFMPEVITVLYRHHASNSYSDIERQLFIAVQSLKKLCPSQWIDESVAKRLSNLSFAAIKRRKFYSLIRIHQMVTMKIRILSILYSIERLLKSKS